VTDDNVAATVVELVLLESVEVGFALVEAETETEAETVAEADPVNETAIESVVDVDANPVELELEIVDELL
jgi:hypothetical protein